MPHSELRAAAAARAVCVCVLCSTPSTSSQVLCKGDLVAHLYREAGCQQSLQKKKTILLFLVLTINFCGGCVLDHICSCYEWIRYSFDFAMTVLLLDKFDLVQ